ncbi:MAG: FKBP-type peptidyl-prolyl cis-trans isomerase [Microbacteriaceae bacterium]|nr:FKBP-type peptidyl-prolyl cis-trans isomerase [Microbacteriaceae bacterium]
MRPSRLMAIALAPVLALSVAACTQEEEPPTEPGTIGTDTPVACSPNGPVSDAISVSGDFDTEPEVDFSAPVSVTALQRTVLIEGDGAEVQDGAEVRVHFTLYNGDTGELIDSTGYDEGGLLDMIVDEKAYIPGLVKTVRCSNIGSRIVSVVPPADAFGETGNTSLGIGADTALVFVLDVVAPVEQLVPAEWTENVPEVEFGSDGAPVVTLPASGPPAELVMSVLEEGDGEVVTKADSPQLDYQGTSWDTGEVFDQSYGGDPIALPAGQYVPGFTAAIVGQRVGVKLLVSIPPELAYGTDASAHPLGGQTLLFVIEIVSIS